MKNKTAILLSSLLLSAAAPSLQAGGVVVHIGASFAPRSVYRPLYAAPVYGPAVVAPPVYYPAPHVYPRPVYVAPVAYAGPYYVPPSARFGYGCGLYGRPRYCW